MRSERFGKLAVLLLVLVMVATVTAGSPAQGKRIRPSFFGMHDARASSGLLPEVSVGVLRLWDSGTSWRQVEKRRGRFDFDALDRTVDTARAAGIRPLLVLGQTPRFHSTHRNAPAAYGRGAASMPRMRPWKRYVRTVARRYDDTIDYQIWNEPNVVNYWRGSTAQMARLTASGARAIRRAAEGRPTVVAPSFPLRLSGQQEWYRQFWRHRVGGRGLAGYVDAVSVHLYPEAAKGPEAQLPLLRYAKRVLPSAARSKPMWNTEINYGLRGGDDARRMSGHKQAAYVARTLVLNAAHPIRRVYWYSWTLSRLANTRLSWDGGTRRTRAGRAWDEVRSWLIRTDVKGCDQATHGRSAGVYTCRLRAGPHQVRRIYWKPSGAGTELWSHRSAREVTRLSGESRTVEGQVRITVGEAPLMVTSRR